MRYVLALLTIAAVSVACCPAPACKAPAPDDPEPVVDPEAPTDEAVRDACHRAGVNLKKLQCAEYRADWDAFCHDEMSDGIPLHPTCLARVTACNQIDKECR